MGGIAATIVILLFSLSDVITRRIPNVLPLVLVVIAVCEGLWLGRWPGVWEAGLVFCGCFLLFCLNLMGGGDVKTLAAGALLVPGRLYELCLVVSLAGGLMAAGAIIHGAIRHERPKSLPYGVAIGVGLLVCIWS